MTRIKVFNENDEYKLTRCVNDWIENNSKYEIKDIKFSNSCMTTKLYEKIYCFSVLIIYDDKIYKIEKE